MAVRIHGVVVTVLLAVVAGSSAAEPTFGTFDAKGVKIRYVEQGSGEPVVLIHGFGASALLNWQLPGVFATLAKDYRVIALDLPGHGGSDKPEKPDAYGPQLAEDVILLLDHLRIPKAHIAGYSLGGMITVKLLTLHPERVLSAAVCGMGWVRDGGRNLGLPAGMNAGEGSGALAVVLSTMGQLSVNEAQLKAIKAPVTLLIGDRDRFKRTVGPLRQVRPDWSMVEVEGASHMSCVFKQQFIDALKSWLDKNRQK